MTELQSLSLTHTHSVSPHTHNALIKGALQCANNMKKDKRGESLRSLEENLTYSSNSTKLGLALSLC